MAHLSSNCFYWNYIPQQIQNIFSYYNSLFLFRFSYQQRSPIWFNIFKYLFGEMQTVAWVSVCLSSSGLCVLLCDPGSPVHMKFIKQLPYILDEHLRSPKIAKILYKSRIVGKVWKNVQFFSEIRTLSLDN